MICYRCGRKMRLIQRLGIFFCDNDGYIMSFRDAEKNRLIRAETSSNVQEH